MPRALITGISGQDGQYLTEFLLGKGYHVVGTARDVEKARDSIDLNINGPLDVISMDLQDVANIASVLEEYAIDEVYNLAAYASGSGMYDDPYGLSMLNGLAVTQLLEAIRAINRNIKLLQASSREIFGVPEETPQSEMTTRSPRSPYGAAKVYADNIINIYRNKYGMFCCSAILYNHESPRRSLDFVTRKVTHTVACIVAGLSEHLELGDIESRRDWGFAGDYVKAMWLMLQQDEPDDYIIATGKTHSIRELCEVAFNCAGLDYRDYVTSNESLYRPSECVELTGIINKAKEKLGWQPEVGFVDLIEMMVEYDLQKINTGA